MKIFRGYPFSWVVSFCFSKFKFCLYLLNGFWITKVNATEVIVYGIVIILKVRCGLFQYVVNKNSELA